MLEVGKSYQFKGYPSRFLVESVTPWYAYGRSDVTNKEYVFTHYGQCVKSGSTYFTANELKLVMPAVAVSAEKTDKELASALREKYAEYVVLFKQLQGRGYEILDGHDHCSLMTVTKFVIKKETHL